MKALLAKSGLGGIIALQCLMTNGGFAADNNIPPEPQLIKDAWLLETYFEADSEAIKAVLPAGLKPHLFALRQFGSPTEVEHQSAANGGDDVQYRASTTNNCSNR
jgi:hypothetical protein